MKRKNQEVNKYQYLINQLLTLFFSGVYITSQEMIDLAANLGIELPSKSRELILKNLFLEAEQRGQLESLLDGLIMLLQERIQQYNALNRDYAGIQEIASVWIHKANTMIRLLHQQKRANPYE
ncbi:hypothetical protein [Candidatus Marinarcus aquaticus]|uniref:Uncharacterized protein n=1 Tax=Candidatus Marinarcus aquaticus TaxID=2044504 RepID=A0A4Q0XS93_9BACT|nr:hypothetical protein [Candidatus Marinarcus aquaticus]RXJ55460.1 hypothetical protein CRV04_10180 [Candidatus Marinarcus aquaticus]